MQSLLDQYTKNIKVDPRTFSTDVMSQDQFSAPFDAWVKNAVNSYMLPDFMRYEYDPTMRQNLEGLYNTNQDIGLSGGWRTAQSAVDMQNVADQAMRSQEQLTRGFNDQALQTADAFKAAWSDPLYKSRMESFYNAPWNQQNTGAVTPTTTPTLPALQNVYQTNQGNPTTGTPYTPFFGGGNLSSQYLGQNGLPMTTTNTQGTYPYSTTQFTTDKSLINQYMKPTGGNAVQPQQNAAAYNILSMA